MRRCATWTGPALRADTMAPTTTGTTMIAGWRAHISRPAAASAVLVLALLVSAPSAQSVRLEGKALAAAEDEARAALASLTEKPTFDDSQAFTVSGAGTRLSVLPARYSPRAPAPLASVYHCALALLRAGRPVEVVRTIGIGYTDGRGCTGLDAIGFYDLDGDGRFEIALLYSTLAPPDRYRKTPVVVRTQGDAFAVDESLTTALNAQGGITTLTALRRAATKRSATPSK